MGDVPVGAVESAPWFYDAVIYQVFPRVYGEGRLSSITEELQSIRSLGVNTLYLMPIHEIGTLRRVGTLGSPYSIRDHLSIAPQLGELDDLRALVDHAHALGMRVIMDLVPNHTSYDNPLVTRNPSWYRLDAQGVPMPPNPEWKDVAQLDFSVQEVRDYITDVARYWLRTANIDGYRVDASVYVPFSFWLEFYPMIKGEFPDAFLLSESGESWLLQAFDSQYDWEFERALAKVLQGESAQLMAQHLASLARATKPKVIYLENHDHRRWLSRFDRSTTVPAALLLLTAPGIPMLYAGQELGAWHTPSLFNADRLISPGDQEIYSVYKELTSLRLAFPELSEGPYQPVTVGDKSSVVAYLRGPYDDPNAAVLVVVNLRAHDVTTSLDLGDWTVDEALWKGGGAELTCSENDCIVQMPEYSGVIFRVRSNPAR